MVIQLYLNMNNFIEIKADLFLFVKNESCVDDEDISFNTRYAFKNI